MSTPTNLLGIPKAPKSGPASSIWVQNSTTNGSIGNRAKVFTNIFQNMGNAITYRRDPVNADSFQVNHSGIYAISYSANSGSADTFAITLNVPATTQSTSLTNGQALSMAEVASADFTEMVSWTGYLNAGDVIRAHQAASVPGANTGENMFTICLVSPT